MESTTPLNPTQTRTLAKADIVAPPATQPKASPQVPHATGDTPAESADHAPASSPQASTHTDENTKATPRLAKPPVMTRFSDELVKLLEAAKGQPMTLGHALDMLKERGDAMFIILITIPFIIPLPAFGLSTPVGVAVALMGICVFRGTRLWLPRKLRDREISYTTLQRVTGAARRLISPIEKLMRPRWPIMFWPGMIHLIGVVLMIAGGSLALPLPVVGTNFIFAIIILPLSLGLLERDGLFVLIGHLVVLLEIVLALVIWYIGYKAIQPYLPTWFG